MKADALSVKAMEQGGIFSINLDNGIADLLLVFPEIL
jgi:hypothetical protein